MTRVRFLETYGQDYLCYRANHEYEIDDLLARDVIFYKVAVAVEPPAQIDMPEVDEVIEQPKPQKRKQTAQIK